jgi:choline dehydrogenase
VAVVEAGSFYEILNSNRTQVPGYDFYSALANFVGGSLESLTNFGLKTAPQGVGQLSHGGFCLAY